MSGLDQSDEAADFFLAGTQMDEPFLVPDGIADGHTDLCAVRSRGNFERGRRYSSRLPH